MYRMRQGSLYPFWQVTAGCPMVCECPAGPPSCPPGVSSVPDACGCCKVCAAQLNQDCHEGRPCDHHKGLECNYGNDVGRTHGICRGTYCERCLGCWQIAGKATEMGIRLGRVWVLAQGWMRECVTSVWGSWVLSRVASVLFDWVFRFEVCATFKNRALSWEGTETWPTPGFI